MKYGCTDATDTGFVIIKTHFFINADFFALAHFLLFPVTWAVSTASMHPVGLQTVENAGFWGGYNLDTAF